MKKTILATVIAAACANAYAIDPFTPLSSPAKLADVNEATAPFVLPSGWLQEKITDRDTLSLGAGSGYATNPANEFKGTFSDWDMVDVSADGRFIYIPFEVQTGAGVGRYDRTTGTYTTLMAGNNTGSFESDPTKWNHLNDDFGAFDPAVLTPWGTLLVGEEWSGNGRLFEIHNPATAVNNATTQASWLSMIPSVSHEGVKFDSAGNLYFVDEYNSGSLYRFVPNTAGDLASGRTEVLVVNDFAGDPEANFSFADTRTGSASWVAITDGLGNALTAADPFDFTTPGSSPVKPGRGGRAAADEVNGTPYGRPEDLEFAKLGNGNDAILFATTSENIIYTIDLGADGNSPVVIETVNALTTPDTLGNNPVGDDFGDGAGDPVPGGRNDNNYGLDDPDNLFVENGPNGELQIFILEDDNPGDVWMATDGDRDGVAEKIELFASLGGFGSEPTGWIADPLGGYLVNIQHPASDNDALWRIYQAPAAVPVPAAAWLFGSALLGLVGVARRKRA